MGKIRENTKVINSFIVENVEEHTKDIVSFTARNFDISRSAAFNHVKKLADTGILESTGKTSDKTYSLKTLMDVVTSISLTPKLEEHKVWEEHILPVLRDISENIHQICMYGFTEMLNNVIDHSEGAKVVLVVKMNAKRLEMRVIDDGVGIFDKIRRALELEDQRHAILELTKGKLTTDPDNHSGQGIFFTSRMFDVFSILSGELFFRSNAGEDWLIETGNSTGGTCVTLEISPLSGRTVTEVFDKYASEKEDFGFTRTHVPVSLAKWGTENLVSRSQAKRLLAGLEKFKEVILDFENVETVGQAFADEIFRVFKNRYPDISLLAINTSEQVEKMITWVRSDENAK